MTCWSIHQILDDLQGAWMTGRDAGDGQDMDHMTATYICIWRPLLFYLMTTYPPNLPSLKLNLPN